VLLALLLDRDELYMAIASLLLNGGYVILLMVLFNQQLIERQKAIELAESLESANAKLAAYASKIETLTIQTERQRMARELHDTLAQGVAGLVLQLEAVKAHLGAQRSERAAAIVEQALTRARSTLAESRAAIDGLRSVPANHSDSIREQIERFTQATGIACTLEISEAANQMAGRITDDIANHAYSILSEALANIARHAQATHVMITCKVQHGQIELDIQDNGTGFDMQQEIGAGHYGLLGMRERARLIGGTLLIESTMQHGTRVHLIAPDAQGRSAQ
jgi:NarL family two-component system sensor histidine kinase YdfH